MKLTNLKLRRLGLIAFALCAGAATVFSQATTSGINGLVLSETGAPVADATVSIVHEPSGTTSRVVTRGNGSFSLRNLRPGGPYTVRASASGFRPGQVEQVSLALDQNTDVTVILQARVDELMELDEFVSEGVGTQIFSSARTGMGTQISSREVERTASADRSLLSIARLDPRITFNPDNQSISASGTNNRYNSIQIDGVSANDPFGLTANNTAARRNVIPLEAVEAVTVGTSPFSARNTGFTGAQVNAVTKSGGNEFSGTLYLTYRDQGFEGNKLDGQDFRRADFEELTLGFVLSGPIIENKLFFLVAYERVREDRVAPSTTFLPTDEALATIQNTFASLGYDAGAFAGAGGGTSQLDDDNILVKIDWNINDDHRASFRFNTVDSTNPSFSNVTFRNSVFDSHRWAQEIENTSYVAQLFSSWTDRISTELSVSYSEYTSQPVFDRRLPMVQIRNVPLQGTTQTGWVTAGTERSRHFNRLEVDTFTIEAIANLELNDTNELELGVQFETADVFNAFVQDFLGRYQFSSVENFANAGTAGWGTSNQDLFAFQFENPGVNPAAEYTERNLGVYAQNTWRPSQNFTLTYGARIDVPSFGNDPQFNQNLLNSFGQRNDVTYGENYVIQPRVGFNYIVDGERTTQFRGGLGLFYGRMPRVWMSNSYSNTGFNFSNVTLTGPNVPALVADPDNQPRGEPAARAQQVAFIADDFNLPTTWKGVIAVDHETGIFDTILTLEAEFTRNENDIFYENLNIQEVGTLPDGRTRYEGLVDRQFTNRLMRLTNNSVGGSQSYTISVERPRDESGWFGRFSYVYTEATDGGFGTSSVAASNWNSRPTFNQDEIVSGRSSLEIRDRILAVVTKDFEYAEGFRTSFGLIYEGRSGLPFNFRVNGDINGDTVSNNDLLFVPNRGGDNRVRFADAQTEELFFQLVDRFGLQEGAATPRNIGRYPFVHRFDLNITQEVPLPGWRHRAEIALDIINVGNLLNDSWGLVRGSNSFFTNYETVVDATFDEASNQLVYSNINEQLAAGDFNVVTSTASRWSALLSVRYRF